MGDHLSSRPGIGAIHTNRVKQYLQILRLYVFYHEINEILSVSFKYLRKSLEIYISSFVFDDCEVHI